jgi:hypothetical protein
MPITLLESTMKLLRLIACCALLSAASPAAAEEKGESIYIDMYGSLVNQYYFRGLRQGSKGVVMQGAADMRVALYDEDDFKFETIGGAFLSFHPADERNGDGLSAALLELRGFLGLGVKTPYMEVSGLFYAYTSPNGTFEDVYELDLHGRFKDDVLWAGRDDDAPFRGLFPAITVAQEVSGSRDGGNVGTYLELDLAPRLRLLHGAILGFEVSFPMALGMSLHDYYQIPSYQPARTPEGALRPTGKIENYFLGYASVGVLTDFEQRWLPERLGEWHGRIGMDVLFPRAQNSAHVMYVDTTEFVVHGDMALDF